jgi:hypothetical protein
MSPGLTTRTSRGLTASDRALIACFALFAFTSLVMEPYFVLGDGLARFHDPLGRAWYYYAASWDPLFLDAPPFLRLICGIDLFVFGPFYLVAIYAFVRRRDWIRIPGLLYATAMLYSMVVYFGAELWTERGRANLALVFLINVPYPIVAVALAVRLRRPAPFATPTLPRAAETTSSAGPVLG